jgi:hypothetical protein
VSEKLVSVQVANNKKIPELASDTTLCAGP